MQIVPTTTIIPTLEREGIRALKNQLRNFSTPTSTNVFKVITDDKPGTTVVPLTSSNLLFCLALVV